MDCAAAKRISNAILSAHGEERGEAETQDLVVLELGRRVGKSRQKVSVL